MWPVRPVRRNRFRRIRRIERYTFREWVWDYFGDFWKRPVCWIYGHQPLYKMDLYGGWLCRRCLKYGEKE